MLAFLICTFGIGSYLVVSLFADNTLYAVLIRFLILALAIMVFGWWLANEVVSPIEKVSLVAKSLERGMTTTLPKTTGSSETDELMQSLHRNNQQMQTLVGLMDKVAGGNLDVTLTPLEQSDRLTNSFQKLLGKVTESIKAKQDLERLKAAIRKITEETNSVRNGNFDVQIESESVQTTEISETLKFLIRELNELVTHVRNESKQAQITAGEIQKTIQASISADETRMRGINQATIALKKTPQSARQISEEFSASASAANQSIERARTGSQTAQANLIAISDLRGQMQEAVKRIGKLTERSQEMGKIAKTVEDLAQRTNMIALNASIQGDELGEAGRGFTVFAEEVERLAERAANTNKQISTLRKTIAAEIGEVEHSLQQSVGKAATLSKFAIETGDSMSELEKYIGRFLNLQTKLVSYAGEQTADTEKAFQIFAHSVTATENAFVNLKESDGQMTQMADSMERLQLAVADFKIVQPAAAEAPAPAGDSAQTYKPNFHA